METKNTIVSQVERPVGSIKRVSWGAVFAGVAIAFVTMLALSLLGLAIGFGTIDPVEERNPLAGLATGAAIWWAFSMLAALFVGGWVAGRLAGIPRRFEAGLHGAVTWALVTLLSVYFISSSVGRLIGGATSIVAQGASLVGQGAAALVPETGSASSDPASSQVGNEVLQSAKNEADVLLRQTGNSQLQPENLKAEAQEAGDTLANAAKDVLTNPGQARQEINQMLDKLYSQGKSIVSSTDREALANVITARTGKSRAEANAIVDRWAASFQSVQVKADAMAEEAEQKARQIGDSAASSLAKAAFWAFAGVALSGLAGISGGCVGRPKNLTPVPDHDPTV